MPIESKSQIFAIPSISDSRYTENHKYLRFATGFLTLGGNLLRVNCFFQFASATHNQNEIWECSIMVVTDLWFVICMAQMWNAFGFLAIPLGCDFVGSHTNIQIYKRSLGNSSHRMVSFVFSLFLGGFVGAWATNNAQIRKCTNSCSRLIDLLNKI